MVKLEKIIGTFSTPLKIYERYQRMKEVLRIVETAKNRTIEICYEVVPVNKSYILCSKLEKVLDRLKDNSELTPLHLTINLRYLADILYNMYLTLKNTYEEGATTKYRKVENEVIKYIKNLIGGDENPDAYVEDNRVKAMLKNFVNMLEEYSIEKVYKIINEKDKANALLNT